MFAELCRIQDTIDEYTLNEPEAKLNSWQDSSAHVQGLSIEKQIRCLLSYYHTKLGCSRLVSASRGDDSPIPTDYLATTSELFDEVDGLFHDHPRSRRRWTELDQVRVWNFYDFPGNYKLVAELHSRLRSPAYYGWQHRRGPVSFFYPH